MEVIPEKICARKREEARFKGRGRGEGTGCGARRDQRPRRRDPPRASRARGPPLRPPPAPTLLPASLTAALPRRAAAAARNGLLRRALGGGGGGHAVGRALLAPVQVAAPGDVWRSGHPVAQVRPGAEGPCREGDAKTPLIPRTPAVAQAIESFRAPRMHRGRRRMRQARPEPTTTGAAGISGRAGSPPPPPPSPPPPRLEKLTTGSYVVNAEVSSARDCSLFRRSSGTLLLGDDSAILGQPLKFSGQAGGGGKVAVELMEHSTEQRP